MEQAVRVIGDTASSAIQEDIDLEDALAEIKPVCVTDRARKV